MRKATEVRSPLGSRSAARRANGWAVGGPVAITLLLLLPPAIGSTPSTSLRAPYAKTTTTVSANYYNIGCGVGKNVIPGVWNNTSGVGGISDRARMRTCAVPFGNYAVASSFFIVYVHVPFRNKVVGVHDVVVNWTFNYSVLESLLPGRCVSSNSSTSWNCYSTSYVSFASDAFLIDVTSNSYIQANAWAGAFNQTYNQTTCTSTGGCSYSQSGGPANFAASRPIEWFVNTTMNRTHDYWVRTDFFVTTVTYEFSYYALASRGTGFAVLNVATLGNGIRLDSITVT